MKKAKTSAREVIMLVLLVALIVGILYYLAFYKPLQAELASLASQASEIDAQITASTDKISKMDAMQAELDQLFSDPDAKISEIAPYDNKEAVLNQLNTILSASEQYSLSFSQPTQSKDGTVRRNVSMNFSCTSFDDAKAILYDLMECPWRCLVGNISISGAGDIMSEGVSVNATITFFESTNLSKES